MTTGRIKNTRVTHAVNREMLRAALGLTDKIHPDFEGTFHDVMLRSRWPQENLGRFTVVVTKSAPTRPGKSSSSTHRVYVLCDCGRLIPAGRLHQHVCKTKETKETKETEPLTPSPLPPVVKVLQYPHLFALAKLMCDELLPGEHTLLWEEWTEWPADAKTAEDWLSTASDDQKYNIAVGYPNEPPSLLQEVLAEWGMTLTYQWLDRLYLGDLYHLLHVENRYELSMERQPLWMGKDEGVDDETVPNVLEEHEEVEE